MSEHPTSEDNEVTARLVRSLDEVSAADWDACANADPQHPDNPFVTHSFLQALEESGSAVGETGWAPAHLCLHDAQDRLVGAAPMYLKSHSYGEYIFDHGWAHAYERAGGQYYPKLQCAVPFTPATGERLLVHAAPQEADRLRETLAGALQQAARQVGVSSLHITFPTKAEWEVLGRYDYLQRTDQQFHWVNRGYRDFQDFLDALASRKRKNLRKERQAALANDIEIEWLTGSDLREEHWDAFFHFYIDTGARKWGTPYLTRSFFSLVGERMPERILLIMAKRAGRYIAGALNFIGRETLYGRNWGAVEHHDFLHFEACYYQAIDFAIERGLKTVEAGAQGSHKLARGYEPTPTYSAHWIADPGFARAVDDYLERERVAVDAEIRELSDYTPFKKAPSPKGGES